MSSIHPRRMPRALLGLAAIVLAGLAFSAATTAAGAADHPGKHHTKQRLVVRGEATILDQQCDGGLCLELVDGAFRGTAGTGGYTGSIKLRFPEIFDNGEQGLCAPIDGTIVLGAGTPNRLVLAVSGDSCQDGGGDPTQSSFTGLAQFSVKYGTGTFAGARGYGLATFSEDAQDRDRMTLIGRISR